jgi:hypothetical protein
MSDKNNIIMTILFLKSQQSFCILVALILATGALGQNINKDDTILINKEKAKWEALKTGDLDMYNKWFADDFVSIGYMPDGSVYRAWKSE